MTRRSSPTVRRRRLGSELRRIRSERSLPAEEVVKFMGWSLSKLSRIESGKTGVTWEAVAALLTYYGIAGEQHEALVKLAREARQEGWWQPYSDLLSKDYTTYIDLETAADTLRIYQSQGLPGLFQTAGYARNVITEAGALILDSTEIDRRVDLRIQRQTLLEGAEPLELWVVLDEAALRRQIASREIMHLQMRHLIEIGRLPNVTLQVMPFEVGSHASMPGSFGIFSFPGGDPDVAFIESFAGTLYLESSDEIKSANLTFNHLQATALSAVNSMRFINAVVKEYA